MLVKPQCLDYRWLILLKDRKKKNKGGKKSKANLKDIFNYCKESGHWKWVYLKKAKKDFVSSLLQNDSSSESDLVLVVGEQLQQHYEQ